MTKSSSVTLLSIKCSSSCNFCRFEMCDTISKPSSAVALYNARWVAKIPSWPLDSLTMVSCSHISCAVLVPLMWIISASLIANSIWVWALASFSCHFLCASLSVSVGSLVFASPGTLASFAMYYSSPRSHNTASILCFHGIQLLDLSISIQ